MKTDNIALMEINVNGRIKKWPSLSINYDQVITLAYGFYNPLNTYTITYTHGLDNSSGFFIENDLPIKTVHGIIFNVSITNKS